MAFFYHTGGRNYLNQMAERRVVFIISERKNSKGKRPGEDFFPPILQRDYPALL